MEDTRESNEEIRKHARLFNWIAPIYNLFFRYQVNYYRKLLHTYRSALNLPQRGKVLDIGCGTGAFLYALAEQGFAGTGVDIAPKMLDRARQSTRDYPIHWVLADVTQGLPFPDKSFDFVVSSYVLHGVTYEYRQKIYQEAERLARQQVIFYDYNTKRRLITDIAEWAEGGDYFNFIKQVESELEGVFPALTKHPVSPYQAIYQCKIKTQTAYVNS